MIDADEEKVVEDGADVVGPVQEKFEEDSAHEVHRHLHPKGHWEDLEVVVEQQKNLAYINP